MRKPTIAAIVISIGVLVAVIGWLALQKQAAGVPPSLTQQEEDRKSQTSSEPQGVRRTISPDEIVSGGPPRDGIPSIDAPTFVSLQSVSFLSDTDLGIALEKEGVKRFYPFSILVWHEIVNDTINGVRVAVTYCPLCVSGVVFDPLVQGERVEFGTSGKLWNSNLVMYDRKTESLWSQILGEAINGPAAGTRLVIIPSDVVRFGEWKKKNPNGEVLSTDTGFSRDYRRDPYGTYYSTPGTYFPLKRKDSRFEAKELILGIVLDGKAKAYPIDSIKKRGRIEDVFAGISIVANSEDDGSVRLYKKTPSGLEHIGATYAFWFSWA
ncbi:DUF3179 domain-containing protein, partial [Candidatus Uhrbacteria bacterium]|nr:DUF3179 domain-containing protein [Candidatus Uhrbacteria bacterium]